MDILSLVFSTNLHLKQPDLPLHYVFYFLFVYFIALLVQALIEREIRMNMKEKGVHSLPIYFEGRECISPTTDKFLSHFNNIELHRLWSENSLVETFRTPLSNKQKELLELAGVPLESYTELG